MTNTSTLPVTRIEVLAQIEHVRMGTMADGSVVRVTAKIDRRIVGRPVQTIEHDEVAVYHRFTAMWDISKPREGGGQTPPEERVIARPARHVKREDIVLLDEFWQRWHLNDVKAGCDHMPAYRVLEQEARDRGIVDDLGRPNVLRLGTTCPESGYKWGTDWLVEPIPEVDVQRIASLLRRLEHCATVAV